MWSRPGRRAARLRCIGTATDATRSRSSRESLLVRSASIWVFSTSFTFNNIGHEEVCVFLRDLLRHLRGPVVASLDNATTHHGKPLADLQRRHPRLHIEHFPSYAPELNPDEGVWSLAKRDLANGCPHDVHELMDNLIRSIDRIRKSPAKLR